MNKAYVLIIVAFLFITGKISACWYPTYEPQYYLAYNLSESSDNSLPKAEMVKMWQKLLPGVTDKEIKSLIYSDGYSIENIRSLNLTPSLNSALQKNPELHDYVVLMRQVEVECDKTVDPWYFYYDNDPKLHKLDSLAQAATSRINGTYGDRYAVQAARALKALKKFNEIIDISQKHPFSDGELQSIFNENLANAFYYTENYDKALELYRKMGDEISLRWTLDKLGLDSGSLALARQLSMAEGNETAIKSLLQSHIHEMEVTSDNSYYWYGNTLSLPEIGDLISTAKEASAEVLECYKPIWQYTEGVAYLINPVDYAKADSVFSKIGLKQASPHLRNQVRTLRFITQCHQRPYNEEYKTWFAKEASWLCETGTEIINAKRMKRAERVKSDEFDYLSRPKEWYQSFCENVVFFRNTHQSYCYPMDMLHRAADCIVVPKMLAAADTVSALQLLDLIDHAGLSENEIKMVDSHGCASVCFAMECGADIAEEALHKLNVYNAWTSLLRKYGSIVSFPDRWNDLIGTLLLAEARYNEAVKYFNNVTSQYAAIRSSSEYDTDRNPFALQFISNQWCHEKKTRMETTQPYYKKWFARHMASLQTIMGNSTLSRKERAKASIEYAVGLVNSVYPCWSLTQYGIGESPFFPYQLTNINNRRATEIIHDFVSDEYFTVDKRQGFDRHHQRLQNLRKQSDRILQEHITALDVNEAASIYEKMGRYLTIKHHFPQTNIAQRLKTSCDRWSDW